MHETFKYLKLCTQLSKAILIIGVLCLQSSDTLAQSEGKSIIAITVDKLKFKGKVVKETGSEILMVLDLVNDTITLVKSSIDSFNDINDEDKIFFDKGRYHRKTGLVNSVGFHIGNLASIGTPASSGVGENPSVVAEYTGYMMIKPSLGLGIGISAKGIPSRQLGYESYGYYSFTEVYLYGKYYLNKNRRRLFIDTKLGYGFAKAPISYSSFGFDVNRKLNIYYSSGQMIQPSIGFEFARARRIRSGIKLSVFYNHTSIEEEIYNGRQDEEVDYHFTTKYFNGLLLGFNFYF